MNQEDFKNSAAGRCIRTITQPSNWAYVPYPLPAKIEMDWELANLLSRADIKLGELSGAGQLLPNPHLLIRPFIRREAVMSSRIETPNPVWMSSFSLKQMKRSRPLCPM